jgi:hypothetical protein
MRNCPMSLLRSAAAVGQARICARWPFWALLSRHASERAVEGGLGLFAPIAMIRIAIRNPRQTVARS